MSTLDHVTLVAVGAADESASGMRPDAHPNYYGAFVLDLDEHDMEAVFH